MGKCRELQIFPIKGREKCYLSLSVWCAVCLCLLCWFVSFLSLFFAFKGKNLVLSLLESNQQIYDFYNWVIFEKQGIMELCKVNLDIGKLLIPCNRNSCCEHITDGVNIYLYRCVSILAPTCPLCVCVCVCVCVCMCVCVKHKARHV